MFTGSKPSQDHFTATIEAKAFKSRSLQSVGEREISLSQSDIGLMQETSKTDVRYEMFQIYC